MYRKAEKKYKIGALEEAKQLYAKILDQNPSNISLLRKYSLISTERGDWAEALKRWEKVHEVSEKT